MGSRFGKKSAESGAVRSREKDDKPGVKEDGKPDPEEKREIEFVKRSVIMVIGGKLTNEHMAWVGQCTYITKSNKLRKDYFGAIPCDGNVAPARYGVYYPAECKIEYIDSNTKKTISIFCVFPLQKKGNGLLVVIGASQEPQYKTIPKPKSEGEKQSAANENKIKTRMPRIA